MNYPAGYWNKVFDLAAELLRSRPDLNGEKAYWLARTQVDAEMQLTNATSVAPQALAELKAERGTHETA